MKEEIIAFRMVVFSTVKLTYMSRYWRLKFGILGEKSKIGQLQKQAFSKIRLAPPEWVQTSSFDMQQVHD